MHKPNIKAAYNAVKKSTIKHSPEILTGIGIAGMVTTTVQHSITKQTKQSKYQYLLRGRANSIPS